MITAADSALAAHIAAALTRKGRRVRLACHHNGGVKSVRLLRRRYDRRVAVLAGNLGERDFCRRAVFDTVREHGSLDILVNVIGAVDGAPAGEPHRGIRTLFHVIQAGLPHLHRGSVILNLCVTSGSASTAVATHLHEAVAAFTRSLASGLARRGVRVAALTVQRPVAPCSRAPQVSTSPSGAEPFAAFSSLHL